MNDRFDHVFVAPSDFDRALAFYRDALGWRSTATWGGAGAPRGAMLVGGGVPSVIAEQQRADDH
jgi:catechol 2,3-dioxygenase-like lactoylglutathione lyase family enzyme